MLDWNKFDTVIWLLWKNYDSYILTEVLFQHYTNQYKWCSLHFQRFSIIEQWWWELNKLHYEKREFHCNWQKTISYDELTAKALFEKKFDFNIDLILITMSGEKRFRLSVIASEWTDQTKNWTDVQLYSDDVLHCQNANELCSMIGASNAEVEFDSIEYCIGRHFPRMRVYWYGTKSIFWLLNLIKNNTFINNS